MRQFLYLHGFSSGPNSGKAEFFRSRLNDSGIDLKVPDLNVPTFRSMTLTSQLELIENILSFEETSILIGSSMGGLVAALASANSSKVTAMILMAPGFQIENRWPEMLDEGQIRTWRMNGYLEFFHHGMQRQDNLDFSFLEDLKNHQTTDIRVTVPTLIFHGIKDTTVPIEVSRHFASSNPSARLVELDDGHDLYKSLEEIWDVSSLFLKETIGIDPGK